MKNLAVDDAGYWGQAPDTRYARATVASGEHNGVPVSMYALGDAADPDIPVAIVVHYPPNWELGRHSHASARFEVVISGSMIIEGRAYGPGSVMTVDAEELYGPHYAGPDGCMTVEVMNGHGARCFTFQNPDGGVTNIDLEDPAALDILLGRIGNSS